MSKPIKKAVERQPSFAERRQQERQAQLEKRHAPPPPKPEPKKETAIDFSEQEFRSIMQIRDELAEAIKGTSSLYKNVSVSFEHNGSRFVLVTRGVDIPGLKVFKGVPVYQIKAFMFGIGS